jgi:hypothetical protein
MKASGKGLITADLAAYKPAIRPVRGTYAVEIISP